MLRNLKHLLLLLIVVAIVSYILIYYSTTLFYVVGIIIQISGLVITVYLLLFDNRGTNSKIAWIAVIIVLPVVGTISFFFFGRNPQKRKFSLHQYTEMNKLREKVKGLPSPKIEETPELSQQISHLTGFVPMQDNDVNILTNGDVTYEEILSSLEQASNHIHMQYYIFREDTISTQIRDTLIKKAKEGVEVRFLYDGWGTKLSSEFITPLLRAGAEIEIYDPIYSFWIARTANLRNHRKIIVIDGQIGFTGGLNVGEEYRSNTADFSFWRDTHMKIEGSAVRLLQEAFLMDWIYSKNEAGSAESFISKSGIKQYFSPVTAGDKWAQVVYGGPYDKERLVRDAMLDLIDTAKKSVSIISPYFVPDEESLAVLRRVAMSGIEVRILLPGTGDRGLSFHGSNAYIETMLEAGAKMYAYDNTSFIHAKMMIVDDEKAAIGTANFDVRSFRLNHELMVFLYGNSHALAHLVMDFERDIEHSTLYTLEEMKHKPIIQKLKEQLSSLFSPIL